MLGEGEFFHKSLQKKKVMVAALKGILTFYPCEKKGFHPSRKKKKKGQRRIEERG